MHFGIAGEKPAPEAKSNTWADWFSNAVDVIDLMLEVLRLL